MRKTIDVPEDLSQDLEKMSSEFNISQSSLMVMAGYALTNQFKKHGKSLFEKLLNSNNHKTPTIYFSPSESTQSDIQFMDSLILLGKFTDVFEFEIYDIAEVPDRYVLKKIGVEGNEYREVYPFVLRDVKGNEVWLSNCRCGNRGEGPRGTHQILSMLGVPFSSNEIFSKCKISHKISIPQRYELTITLIDSDPISLIPKGFHSQFKIQFNSIVDYRKARQTLHVFGYPDDFRSVFSSLSKDKDYDLYHVGESPEVALGLGAEFGSFGDKLFESFVRRLAYMHSGQIHEVKIK